MNSEFTGVAPEKAEIQCVVHSGSTYLGEVQVHLSQVKNKIKTNMKKKTTNMKKIGKKKAKSKKIIIYYLLFIMYFDFLFPFFFQF